MRQFSANQNQPAKTSPARPATSKSVTPERARPPEHDPSQTAAPRSGFEFGRIAVHAATPALMPRRSPAPVSPDAAAREVDLASEPADEGHKQPSSIQMKSLDISRPDDPDENEADDVARKIVAGHPATINSTGAAANRNHAERTAPEFISRLERNSGGGQSLDDSIRQEMEEKTGADFSGVTIHNDGEANRMNEEVNARAFTRGQDIFFRQGEFDTNSRRGKELLAHELTHTVQNRVSNPAAIQRKILINGTPHEPTKEEKDKYGEELLDNMHNDGQEPDYIFSSDEEFKHNLQIRGNVIATILAVIGKNNRSVKFGFYNEVAGEFRMPPQWVRTTRAEYHVKEGIAPADAVESIFNNNDQLTYLDCNAMMIAIQYKALLDTYGAERFNKMFPDGQNLIIGQNKLDDPKTVKKEGYQSTASGSHPLYDQGLYTQIDVAEGEDAFAKLLPGDWLYFKNAKEYLEYRAGYHEALTHSSISSEDYGFYARDGAWRGEHAIYLGEKKFQEQQDEKQQATEKTGRYFAGFGISQERSYDQMISKLILECKIEYKVMKLAQKDDFVSEFDVDDVSDSVVKDKPRISTIFRPNTAKIELLGK